MIVHAIDQKIRKAFSDAAMQYDMLTSLHKEIGRELTKKVMGHEPCSAVLDIGMGTGWFTHRLTNIFPDAMVVGLDFASGMVAYAQKKEGTFKTVQADASRLPFKSGVFDLITSNLAYQWISDLPQTFRTCRSRLKQEGQLCFTMFGHDTFQELFKALAMTAPDQNIKLQRLATKDQVIQALDEAGFEEINVSSEHIKVRFEDMMSLVRWVKDIGANALPKDFFIGKDLLLKANDYYNSHFSDRLGIYATFEVIWVEAQ